jgi:glycosyltransferase involved in cell wall biosynthesis
MRILLVTQAYPPFFEGGGASEEVQNIAEGLAARDHCVTVLTMNHRRSLRSASVARRGVEVIYLGSPVHYRFAGTLNPGMVPFCRQRLARFEVVHIFGIYDLIGPVVAFACRHRGVPYVLSPQGMYPPIVRSFAKKGVYARLVGRSLFRGAGRVVATSERERDGLLPVVARSNLVVRPCGVDLGAWEQQPRRGQFRRAHRIPDADPLVVYLGRLTPKKRPDLLLEAFAALGRSTASLAFVGPDEDHQRSRLERRMRELDVADRVILTGPLYGEDKRAALADADVFVLPSSDESFGIAAVEAMAAGTAVIITDQCGVAPYVGQGAGLVVAVDADALRGGLARLLSQPSLREQMGSRGRTVAQSLGWTAAVAATEALYVGLLGDGPRSGQC